MLSSQRFWVGVVAGVALYVLVKRYQMKKAAASS